MNRRGAETRSGRESNRRRLRHKEERMLPEYIRNYMFHGLAATPVVVDRLLKDTRPEDWDRRPDPERFTIREVVAHLADWEGVWLDRSRRIAEQDQPELQSYDEGQWAIDHGDANLDVGEQQAKFRAGREELISYLRGLPLEAWDRSGRREFGPISIG